MPHKKPAVFLNRAGGSSNNYKYYPKQRYKKNPAGITTGRYGQKLWYNVKKYYAMANIIIFR